MRYLLVFVLLILFSGCAHSPPPPSCIPGPGCQIPDQEWGDFDSDPRSGVPFSYSCYEKLPVGDAAVCRTSYGLSPAEILTGKQNCGGIVLDHRCPTNPMLYCWGRHSRGDPARPMFTYLYFGDPTDPQVVSKADLLGGDTFFNSGFLGRH